MSVRSWGATADERARPLPCDRWLPDADEAYYRAIDVRAPAETVFRWLCQLRLAPYSYDWIDNWGRESPRCLVPGMEQLETGQSIMTIFKLVEFERDRHLTCLLERGQRWFGRIALTYDVRGAAGGSRLLAKLRISYPPGARGLAARLLLPAGDLVMMRKQLKTLRNLAERTT
jgi:hypothetical protein